MKDDRSKIKKEIREALEKNHGKGISDEQIEKAEKFLRLFAEIAVEQTMIKQQWINKLDQYPRGFQLDGEGRNCPICHIIMSKGEGWYDKNGLKCVTCQKAIEKRIIPASLMKKPEGYYTEIELDIEFNLKRKVLNSWIKEKIIVARVIPALEKGIHIRLFLLKDNKGFLPPKHLLKGGVHIEEKDGKEEYVFGPWYWYCNPVEKLAKYRISQYMTWEVPNERDST